MDTDDVLDSLSEGIITAQYNDKVGSLTLKSITKPALHMLFKGAKKLLGQA
jgi:hypothetical protein